LSGTGREPVVEAVDMTPVDGETQRLRELHELYVWQVNAAVGEGRYDLVEQLADEYLEEALAELARSRPDGTDGACVQPADLLGTGAWEVVEARPSRPRAKHVPWWRRLLAR
jgi:hypothetical protein